MSKFETSSDEIEGRQKQVKCRVQKKHEGEKEINGSVQERSDRGYMGRRDELVQMKNKNNKNRLTLTVTGPYSGPTWNRPLLGDVIPGRL
jgi:hypothetical protein